MAETARRLYPRIVKNHFNRGLPHWPDTNALIGVWPKDKRKRVKAPYKELWIKNTFCAFAFTWITNEKAVKPSYARHRTLPVICPDAKA
jgi:hypothetical protein